MKRLPLTLLGIWLIVVGLVDLLGLSFAGSQVFLAVLGLAAGVTILLDFRSLKLAKNLGWLLLGIWLVLVNLLSVASISFPSSGLLLGLLGVTAGVLILLNR